jgi:hypothetical protein
MEQNERRPEGNRALALSVVLAALVAGPPGVVPARAQGSTVTVSITADKSRIYPGDILLYRVRVRNNGSSAATNVVLTASPA